MCTDSTRNSGKVSIKIFSVNLRAIVWTGVASPLVMPVFLRAGVFITETRTVIVFLLFVETFSLEMRRCLYYDRNMEERIGSIVRYFEKTSIAAVKLDFGDLTVGDTVRIKGAESDFSQKIDAMEFDHKPVQHAARGQFIGIKLTLHAKPFDLVYKVSG